MGSTASIGAPLRVRLLGDLELRREDGPAVPLPPSRRTRALLGYLVATGTPQSRATLCDLLWDGPDDPRAALRWSLTKLRAVVDDEAALRLQADRDRVGFDACVVRDRQRACLALLHGRIPRACRSTRSKTRRARCRASSSKASSCRRAIASTTGAWPSASASRAAGARCWRRSTVRLADDPQRALPHGRAMVAADPLAEGAHATLVRLLAAAGRYPEAERHYDWARELLRREVALPDGGPLDEAIRAVRRQQRQAAAAPRPPAPAPAASPARRRRSSTWHGRLRRPRPALLGRDDECQAIDAALAAPQQAPCCCSPASPASARRACSTTWPSAPGPACDVIRARCFEAEAVRPYGLWLDALRGLPADGSAHRCWRRRRRCWPAGGSGQPRAPVRSRRRAAGGLRRSSRWRAGGRPAVDRRRVGRAAALRGAGLAALRPVLFAGAARAGEIDDNPCARGLLHSLARERALLRRPAAAGRGRRAALAGRTPGRRGRGAARSRRQPAVPARAGARRRRQRPACRSAPTHGRADATVAAHSRR